MNVNRLAIVLVLVLAGTAHSQGGRVVVKLVSDFDSARLVSELEEIRPVTTTRFEQGGSREEILGQRCVLWVRNAHIDGKFFFERYYQDKYIGRKAILELDAKELGVGKHVFQPGNHVFTLGPDGKLSSEDPDIRIQDSTVLLRLHRVDVLSVDASKQGPADFRLLPADLGVLALDGEFRIDPAKLPDPRKTLEPRKPPAKGQPVSPLMNVLSEQKRFYPLSIWLPANQVGQGYLLYPSWQTFHVRPGGGVELAAAGGKRVAGIEAERNRVLVPYYPMTGKVPAQTGLSAGVGAETLREKMTFGATLAQVQFLAGLRDPRNEPPLTAFAAGIAGLGTPLPVLGTWLGTKPTGVALPVDNDLSRRPFKHFVADNTADNREAIRLMVLEWDRPIFARNSEVSVGLRLLDSPLAPTLTHPEARVYWSSYSPSNPLARVWNPLGALSWNNGRDRGELRFRTPNVEAQFVVLRVQVAEAGDSSESSPLTGEINAFIASPDQEGSVSFSANRGRNAFVAGEDIDLTLVFRSRKPRDAEDRIVTLAHPDGYVETLNVRDSGETWLACSLRIPAARSRQLAPGKYTLSLRDPPRGLTVSSCVFDLAGRQAPSLFHIVKPSKYTGPMNDLEPSHLLGKPIDLDRAMKTLADLGYNRVDHMSYMTNHHLRAYAWREELAALDPRLPAPESVFTPTPRDQMLNASVRHQLQFSDVWLSYGDFYLPRYIEPYIKASERWMAREVQAMRHSPAWDGLILYDEMYQNAAVGIVKEHTAWFNKVRARVAEATLGQTPKKIEELFSRYHQRPRDQRDPKVLQEYLRYLDWQQNGWVDYVERVVKTGKALEPRARFGTYYRTWMAPGTSDDLYHGYPPELFRSLDVIGHIHYADNSTSWVSIPQMARILRTGKGKTLYVNMPIGHEWRTQLDGQYQRHMAFAMLAQGSNGISQWGLPTTFTDGPNPTTAQARDTTAILNRDILQPFGEIVDRTGEGYRKVGIVSTKNQLALAAHKSVPTPCQTEGIWIACWRLGYPALFVREEHCKSALEGYSVLFVPGVRFDGELDEAVVRRLKEAIAAGTKVVVEADSVLDLPGLTKLSDWKLDSYFAGDNYFPTWLDDELNKVFEKSQAIVDYLSPKFREWRVEPAATGPFTVGPGWRDGGQAQYLIAANFEDPQYRHTVKQQMAHPVLMPLTVARHRGQVAYDLLAGKEVPLREGPGQTLSIIADMRRIQGAIIAFLPERVGKLAVHHATSTSGDALRLRATLQGESGKKLDAVFPVRIVLRDGKDERTFFRVLGGELAFELDLPRHAAAPKYTVEIREALSGRTVTLEVQGKALDGASLNRVNDEEPAILRPGEVGAFLKTVRSVVVVPGKGLADGAALAKETQAKLEQRGIKARIATEESVGHQPLGDPKAEDPLGDGYHSWHSGQEVIAPALIVEEPVVLLAGRGTSFLLDALAEHGYLSIAPLGGPGQPVRPSLQVAAKGLSHSHDTLCLIANDATTMRRAIAHLGGDPKPASAPAGLEFAAPQTTESERTTPSIPAVALMGTNEMVMDLGHDRDGNLHVITWGHGKNYYSLSADGKQRFSRFLPAMGANHLGIHDERVYVYTSAGAKLYHMTLDGTPVTQARLNMDPGPANVCDEYSLSSIDYQFLPAKKWLFHNHYDRMRVLDDEYRLVAEWRGEVFRDRDVSDEVLRRNSHAFVLSPDRTRIAQLESSWYFTKAGEKDREVRDTHLVVRDLSGKLLHEYRHLDNGFEIDARLTWPAGTPGPLAFVKEERWSFSPELGLLKRERLPEVAFWLNDTHYLTRQDRFLVYHDGFRQMRSRLGPFEVLPTFAALSPNGAWIVLEDEAGQVTLHNSSNGAMRTRFLLPERGNVLRFSPDSKTLLVGTYRGSVLAYDLDGKPLWQTRLADFNNVLGGTLPLSDAAFPDHTAKLWPVSRDEPGDLEKLVRLDVNRLTPDGWKGAVLYHDGGMKGGRCLKVGEKLVGQEVSGFLGEHVTWVLEFHYRAAAGKGELLAGLLAQGQQPDSVARKSPADDTWRFGRIVIKNGAKCEKLKAGFSATDGEILLDGVQLRRVRFPSVNHLLHEPLHAIRPVMLENLLLASKYNPFGALREQTPNRVLLPNLPTGSLPLLDACYLQNGKLNDVTSRWYIHPTGIGQDLMLSLGLKEPRWVNTVVLYFNAYDEANITPHLDILASDLEAKTDRVVARVRQNGQLMRIVKFPPIRTSLLKVRFVNSVARLRTLTEVEVYGPLSGQEGTPGFTDTEGQNTYMGDFSRVDKRIKRLPDVFRAPQGISQTGDEGKNWAAPLAQPLVSRDSVFLGRTFGYSTAHPLAEPAKELSRSRANGAGFTPYGTLYGGLLLRPGIDGKLYCLHPDSGSVLWSVPLGERLFGCPVVIAEDVFITGGRKLYQIDLASGGILREAAISAAVHGSPASDGKLLFFITEDGFLQCWDATTFKETWKVAVAPFTDSTPAVDGGVVYLADQKGTARALRATDGKEIWKAELGDEFSRCPVVGEKRIVLGCRGGTLAVLERDTGKIAWSRKVRSRFDYEPLILGEKLLYFRNRGALLADLADGKEKAFQYSVGTQPPVPLVLPHDPLVSMGYYKGHLLLIDRTGETGHNELRINYPWHPNGGTCTILGPAEEKKP